MQVAGQVGFSAEPFNRTIVELKFSLTLCQPPRIRF